MDIKISSWADIIDEYPWFLRNIEKKKIIFPLWLRVLKRRGLKLSNEHTWELFHLVDWEFLRDYPATPPKEEFSFMFTRYVWAKENLENSTALEFQLMENQLIKYQETGDKKHLKALTYCVVRPRDLDGYVEREDKRKPFISETDLMVSSAKLILPPWVYIGAIIFAQTNLKNISDMYGRILTGGKGKSDGLGWTSTFMSVAESGIFGDINQVYKTNIHTILTFIYKKQVEFENQSSPSTITRNF